MNKLFPAFYSGPPDENESWETTAFFSFDSNVLLNIYGFSSETQNTWFDALKHVSSRTYITYQAAYEYHKNLAKKWREIDSQESTTIKKFFDSLETSCKQEPADSLMSSRLSESAKVVRDAISSQRKAVEGEFNKLKQQQKKERLAVRDKIAAIISEERVGQPPDEATLRTYYEMASARYEHRIPPGFTDKDKSQGNPYGDAIIWFELKSLKKPFVFVTFETKKDWFASSADGELVTSPHLRSEMLRDCQNDFECIPANKFLKWFERRAGKDSSASEETAKVDQDKFRLWGQTDTLRVYFSKNGASQYDGISPYEQSRVNGVVGRILKHANRDGVGVEIFHDWVVRYEWAGRSLLFLTDINPLSEESDNDRGIRSLVH